MKPPEIVLTHEDFRAICTLLADPPISIRRTAERLDEEIARARLVPRSAVGSDVVTMNTRVIVEELTSNVRRIVTVVYPDEADREEGRVSVLSPLGSALIGLRVGQTIEWSTAGESPIAVSGWRDPLSAGSGRDARRWHTVTTVLRMLDFEVRTLH